MRSSDLLLLQLSPSKQFSRKRGKRIERRISQMSSPENENNIWRNKRLSTSVTEREKWARREAKSHTLQIQFAGQLKGLTWRQRQQQDHHYILQTWAAAAVKSIAIQSFVNLSGKKVSMASIRGRKREREIQRQTPFRSEKKKKKEQIFSLRSNQYWCAAAKSALCHYTSMRKNGYQFASKLSTTRTLLHSSGGGHMID